MVAYSAVGVAEPAGNAGQLGATYWIPILYVPILMVTHFTAVYLLVRPQLTTNQTLPDIPSTT